MSFPGRNFRKTKAAIGRKSFQRCIWKGKAALRFSAPTVDSVLGVFLWHLWGRKEANLLKAFSCQRSPWEATASEGHSGRRVAQSQTQGKGLDLIQVKPFEDLQDQEHSALLLVRHLKRRNPGLNPSKLMGCQGLTWEAPCEAEDEWGWGFCTSGFALLIPFALSITPFFSRSFPYFLIKSYLIPQTRSQRLSHAVKIPCTTKCGVMTFVQWVMNVQRSREIPVELNYSCPLWPPVWPAMGNSWLMRVTLA
jgi:hypothetical protein